MFCRQSLPAKKKTSQRPWLNAVASYHLGFHCGCVVDAGDDLIDEEDLDDLDDLDDDDDRGYFNYPLVN